MISSSIFDKHGRTEIGLQFSILLSPLVLNIGVTQAIFRSSWKILFSRAKFNICNEGFSKAIHDNIKINVIIARTFIYFK